MYEIDNEKFGAFLALLRKAKGMTQRELAEKLYVSDKAVSKWERGLSLPDITLLQPLAETLGASVTELLRGEPVRPDQPLTLEEVEPLVAGRLALTAREQEERRDRRRRWGVRFFAALLACAAEAWLCRGTGWLWDDYAVELWLPPGMALGFGGYLIFFAREKLPAFYDQYPLNFVSDGAFRMNVPGVRFNNRNWPHVLDAMRAWACATLAGWVPLYCLVRWAAALVLPGDLAATALLALCLLGSLGGLFLPVYAAGRKYE